jgi:hypothetical protein
MAAPGRRGKRRPVYPEGVPETTPDCPVRRRSGGTGVPVCGAGGWMAPAAAGEFLVDDGDTAFAAGDGRGGGHCGRRRRPLPVSGPAGAGRRRGRRVPSGAALAAAVRVGRGDRDVSRSHREGTEDGNAAADGREKRPGAGGDGHPGAPVGADSRARVRRAPAAGADPLLPCGRRRWGSDRRPHHPVRAPRRRFAATRTRAGHRDGAGGDRRHQARGRDRRRRVWRHAPGARRGPAGGGSRLRRRAT